MAWMRCNDCKSMFHNTRGNQESNTCNGCVTLETNDENPFQAFVEIISSVEMGAVEVTKHLIEEEGFDVNKNNIIDNGHFQFSKSSLSVALTLPDMEILRYLMSRKELNVNCR